MPAIGALMTAAIALALPARSASAADPVDTGRSQAVTVQAPGADDSRKGTVNLQGFVQPLDTRSLAPMHVTTSVVSMGGLEAGTLVASRSDRSAVRAARRRGLRAST